VLHDAITSCGFGKHFSKRLLTTDGSWAAGIMSSFSEAPEGDTKKGEKVRHISAYLGGSPQLQKMGGWWR
jgi:hypothetical protein